MGPCMDDGVTVGVVDSGGDPLLAVRGVDVSRSWIGRGVRSPLHYQQAEREGYDKMGVTSIQRL